VPDAAAEDALARLCERLHQFGGAGATRSLLCR